MAAASQSAATPVSAVDDAAARSFALLVSVTGGKPVRYVFDQDRVLVGRGRTADLRVEHAAMSRTQFLIERGRGSAGEARFRITPYDTTNPTHVNERAAVEGTLTPGDVIGVGEVRVVLERKLGRAAAPDGAPKKDIPPLRAALLAACTLMALYVGYLLFSGDDAADAVDLDAAQVKLFADTPPNVHCGNPVECDTRAHDAYARGKKLFAQASIDPGNSYRAVKELDRAARFRDDAGRPLADMNDLDALRDQAKQRAETEFHDARFRLQRARTQNDVKRCVVEAGLLARIVPDDNHPFRVKLDAYRRSLPRPNQAGVLEPK